MLCSHSQDRWILRIPYLTLYALFYKKGQVHLKSSVKFMHSHENLNLLLRDGIALVGYNVSSRFCSTVMHIKYLLICSCCIKNKHNLLENSVQEILMPGNRKNLPLQNTDRIRDHCLLTDKHFWKAIQIMKER